MDDLLPETLTRCSIQRVLSYIYLRGQSASEPALLRDSEFKAKVSRNTMSRRHLDDASPFMQEILLDGGKLPLQVDMENILTLFGSSQESFSGNGKYSPLRNTMNDSCSHLEMFQDPSVPVSSSDIDLGDMPH